jgi:hypothetical protein
MDELARRGHEITVISPFPRKEPVPNYTDITVMLDMNVLSGGHGKQIAATCNVFRRTYISLNEILNIVKFKRISFNATAYYH